ncbi:hypothetical protein BM524_02435 [Alteromonas mediterranea]|uniref:Uncharacterized protein n=1 Tax=Alteromonas mediterranea TaxID=314275 RepID=A0AAC9NQZ2_9ALTE|nr:hypothetical protein BM524_02435 [Alteromonas mediterranea]
MFKYRNFRKNIKFGSFHGLESFLIEIALGLIFSVISYHSYKTDMLIIALPLGLLGSGCIVAAIISGFFYFKLKRTEC